jgi:4,5-dihydroxyphthalate decarboxylase
MKKLPLTLACWDYDRTRALLDGTVRPDGIDLTYLPLEVEETFFRMARYQEFDVSEMSLSSYVRTLESDHPPFIAIPVFPSRMFRHASVFISSRSNISRPQDLKGRKVGVPEYQMTAPVWIRGILSDEYGVKVEDVEHFSGGEEDPGREEKLKLDLPRAIRLRPIGPEQTLSAMLAEGEIDALVTARAPSTFYARPDKVERLFPDYLERERDYYRRTGIFPIMHTVVMRREVYEKNRWIAQSLAKAFTASQREAYRRLSATHTLATMLPAQVAMVEDARRDMGDDWWPYGLAPNRKVLETFLRYHAEQGLSKRPRRPEDLFAPETLESFKV